MNRLHTQRGTRHEGHRLKLAKVSSLRERREREQYAGFEGKVMIFDETVALGPAQLVELVDIEHPQQESGND